MFAGQQILQSRRLQAYEFKAFLLLSYAGAKIIRSRHIHCSALLHPTPRSLVALASIMGPPPPTKNTDPSADKNYVDPDQLLPANITSPKHKLDELDAASEGEGHQESPPKKAKTSDNSDTMADAISTIVSGSHAVMTGHRRRYRRWELSNNFAGRLKYWENARKSDSRSYHELTKDHEDNLNNTDITDVHIALTCVTEVILGSSGRPAYSLMAPNAFDLADEPQRNITVARPGKPLLFPFLVNCDTKALEELGPKFEKKLKSLKARKLDAKEEAKLEKQLGKDGGTKWREIKGDIDAKAHILLVAAELLQGTFRFVDDSQFEAPLPLLRIMNSSPRLGIDKPDVIPLRLANLEWLQAKTIHGEARTVHTRKLAMYATIEAANQEKAEGERRPCGLHTILNRWALAMGLERRINPGCGLEEKDCELAIKIIELAFSGHCDFWLIYCFMLKTKFIHALPPQTWPINKTADLSQEDAIISDADVNRLFKILIDDGVKMFDRTMAIEENGGNFLSARMKKEVQDEKEARAQRRADGLSSQESSEIFGQTNNEHSEISNISNDTQKAMELTYPFRKRIRV